MVYSIHHPWKGAEDFQPWRATRLDPLVALRYE